MLPYLVAGLIGAGAAMATKDKKKGRKKYAEGGRTEPTDTLSVYPHWPNLEKSRYKNVRAIKNGYDLDKFLSQIKGWDGDPENGGTMMYDVPEEEYNRLKTIIEGLLPVRIRKFDPHIEEEEEEDGELLDKVREQLKKKSPKLRKTIRDLKEFMAKNPNASHDDVTEFLKGKHPEMEGDIDSLLTLMVLVQASDNYREAEGLPKYARGGRLDERAIKEKLDDIGVEYERFLEEGADLDEIQRQYLGFIYDSDTNTWSSFKGGRSILEQSRPSNTYKTPVSQKVQDSAREFAYLLDSVLRALSLPHVKTYGWNGSSFDAVGSYDYYIGKGDDFDERTDDLIRRDYHDNVEEVLKFVCEMTGAVLEEYDREAPNITGSVAGVDIDAMVEAQEKRRAELRKKFGFAKGGTTGDAEERAFAEYMEDYGVDREEAEDQFLGEFDNKGQWAAEFVDDTGGMESLIDPERFYRIDTDGFRQFALDEASERSADIDKDNADEYAEKFDLEEEYEEAVEEDFHIRKGALRDFIIELQKKEEEAVLDDLMRNYTTADEIINNLGPNYGMGLDDLENAYLIMPDYDEVADALEDDGYVFIEEDFKTFVFNPNMARGGRTKRMKKGGKVKGLDKYGSWYYMDDDGTLFVRYQEVGEDKAPKWDEDDDEWGVVEERAFGTMERQVFEKDMKKLFGRKPKLG